MVRFRYTIRSMLLACTIIGSFLGGWRVRDRLVSRLKAELIAAEAQRSALLASARVSEAKRTASEAKRTALECRLAFAEVQSKMELDLERSRTRALMTRLKAAEALNEAAKRHKPNSDTGQ